MTIERTDLGGGHSPRELDARTNTFVDDTSPATPRSGLMLRDRLTEMLRDRSMTKNMMIGAAVGAGLLLFGWRWMSARSRRASRWPARIWPAMRRR